MNATLYYPGQQPRPVLLATNTREAAAALLGLPPVVVFPLAEALTWATGFFDLADCPRGWGDFHGHLLIITD